MAVYKYRGHTEAIENLSRSGWIRVDTWKQEGAREFFHRFFPRQRLKKKKSQRSVKFSERRGEGIRVKLRWKEKKKKKPRLKASILSLKGISHGNLVWISSPMKYSRWCGIFFLFFFCNATRRSHILCKIITRDRGRGIFWRIKIVTLL